MSLEHRKRIYDTLVSEGINGTVVSPVSRSEDLKGGLDPSLVDIIVPDRSTKDRAFDALREAGILLRDIKTLKEQKALQVEQGQEPIVLSQLSHRPVTGSAEEILRFRNLATQDSN